MVTNSRFMQIHEALQSTLRESFNGYLNTHADDFAKLSYDAAHDKIGEVFANLKSIVVGTTFEDYGFPKFIASYKTYEKDGKLDYADVTIKASLKAETKYKYTVSIAADGFLKKVSDAFEVAVMQLQRISIAEENLKALNARISDVLQDVDCVKISFVLGDNFVEDITDKEIVFGATVEAALNVSAVKIMQYSDDYTEFNKYLAEDETAKLVEALKDRTAPQVLKAGISLIETMTELHSKKRADKLLRLTYHKQAKFFDSLVKGGVGYVSKTIKVDGEEVEIFALLEKSAEGDVSVKLSPFNIKTTFNVDYDILNNYKD